MISVFDDKRDELERHEFQMGIPRGRLAVTLDLLTDALVLAGQHGVYCRSNRNPAQPATDIQAISSAIEDAKQLIQSVMQQLEAEKKP
jgi:hypothetical protein